MYIFKRVFIGLLIVVLAVMAITMLFRVREKPFRDGLREVAEKVIPLVEGKGNTPMKIDDEAYITLLTGPYGANDVFKAYLYESLALFTSIRNYDKLRQCIVGIEKMWVEVFPEVFDMFALLDVDIYLMTPLESKFVVPDKALSNWKQAYHKLTLFQLESLGYQKLLYIDCDCIVMRDPKPYWDLPFEDGIEAYGMRDLDNCRVDFDANAFQGAVFILSNFDGRRAYWSNRISNLIFDALHAGDYCLTCFKMVSVVCVMMAGVLFGASDQDIMSEAWLCRRCGL
jgi:hypothetical protein